MKLKQIQAKLAKLNAAKPAKKPPVKKAAPVDDMDALLHIMAERIATAFNMQSRGISADTLVAGVLEHEKQYREAVVQ